MDVGVGAGYYCEPQLRTQARACVGSWGTRLWRAPQAWAGPPWAGGCLRVHKGGLAQLSSVTLGARTGTEAGEGLAFRSPTRWALLHRHPPPPPIPLPPPRLLSRVLLLQLGRAAPGVGCVFQTHRAAGRNSHAQDRGFQTSTSVYNRQYMFHRDSPKRRSFILRITFMAEYFLLERFSGSVRMLGAHSLPSRVQVLSRAARYLGAGRC